MSKRLLPEPITAPRRLFGSINASVGFAQQGGSAIFGLIDLLESRPFDLSGGRLSPGLRGIRVSAMSLIIETGLDP